jgi:hypothetical protein
MYQKIYIPPNNWPRKGNLYFSDYILESRLRIKLYIKLKYKTEIWEKCHSGVFFIKGELLNKIIKQNYILNYLINYILLF